jgi:hypothetical protein
MGAGSREVELNRSGGIQLQERKAQRQFALVFILHGGPQHNLIARRRNDDIRVFTGDVGHHSINEPEGRLLLEDRSLGMAN